MSLRLTLTTLGLTGLMAACAPAAGPGAVPSDGAVVATETARQCFFQRDVRNFRVSSDQRNVYVRGLNKTVYRLETIGSCPDLDTSTMTIGFAPQGGVNRLCGGDLTRLVIGGPTMSPMPCQVRLVGALTEAEIAALPDRDRP